MAQGRATSQYVRWIGGVTVAAAREPISSECRREACPDRARRNRTTGDGVRWSGPRPTHAREVQLVTQSTIADFVAATAQQDSAAAPFQLENAYLLELNLSGRVWTKAGAMVAYVGDVKFTREGMLEHGLGKMMKRMVSGEVGALMKVEGRGRVYLADRGKKVRILQLTGETIFVNGNDLLAMQETIDWDITMMRKAAGVLTGGLFNIKLSGTGLVAITAHYDPLTLRVTPGTTLVTDPNATVAWSGSLAPKVQTNIDLRTMMGRGSGEAIRLEFSGDGWVVVQPYEEAYLQGAGPV